jgi:hypothetical protein
MVFPHVKRHRLNRLGRSSRSNRYAVRVYEACRAAAVLMALGALVLAGLCKPVSAYVPPVDDLWARLTAGVPPIKSAIVDTENLVYDPAAPAPEGAPGSQNATGAPPPAPVPLKDRSFRQRLYWQRGGLLAVETSTADGTLAHLLLRNGYRTFAKSLVSAPAFAAMDLHPVLFPFLEGSATAWHNELIYWGIQPVDVSLALVDTHVYDRLGEAAGGALWIDPIGDRPVKLQAKIGGSAPLLMEMTYSDFIGVAPKEADAADPRVPKTILYTVNGKLFRKTTVVEVQADATVRNFPIARWRQILGIPDTAPPFAFGKPEVPRS